MTPCGTREKAATGRSEEAGGQTRELMQQDTTAAARPSATSARPDGASMQTGDRDDHHSAQRKAMEGETRKQTSIMPAEFEPGNTPWRGDGAEDILNTTNVTFGHRESRPAALRTEHASAQPTIRHGMLDRAGVDRINAWLDQLVAEVEEKRQETTLSEEAKAGVEGSQLAEKGDQPVAMAGKSQAKRGAEEEEDGGGRKIKRLKAFQQRYKVEVLDVEGRQKVVVDLT